MDITRLFSKEEYKELKSSSENLPKLKYLNKLILEYNATKSDIRNRMNQIISKAEYREAVRNMSTYVISDIEEQFLDLKCEVPSMDHLNRVMVDQRACCRKESAIKGIGSGSVYLVKDGSWKEVMMNINSDFINYSDLEAGLDETEFKVLKEKIIVKFETDFHEKFADLGDSDKRELALDFLMKNKMEKYLEVVVKSALERGCQCYYEGSDFNMIFKLLIFFPLEELFC